MTAAHDWLDLRVPFDDAARRHSLSLLNQLASALRSRTPGESQAVTVIDIGAGTGNSARWFRQHLPVLLPGQPLRWVLVDTDQAALDTAVATLPGVETVTANISQLPSIPNDQLAPAPGRFLITGSAVLDVLPSHDLQEIVVTLVHIEGWACFYSVLPANGSSLPPIATMRRSMMRFVGINAGRANSVPSHRRCYLSWRWKPTPK